MASRAERQAVAQAARKMVEDLKTKCLWPRDELIQILRLIERLANS